MLANRAGVRKASGNTIDLMVPGEQKVMACVLIALISLENLEVRDAGSSVIELNGSKSTAAKVATEEGCCRTTISCDRDDLNLPQQ